jgi:2-iminobutanoate/2-iminopropanoate deaminase
MKTMFKMISVLVSLLLPMMLSAADAAPRFLVLDPSPTRAQLPFSDAVHVGDTLYVAGTLGMDPGTLSDPKTARVAADPADEARFALDAVKHTLEAGGFKMDDLVSVTIYCTDLDLYGTFNDVYRTYFHGHFPARAFIGASKLVRGARFEVMGTAVKGSY